MNPCPCLKTLERPWPPVCRAADRSVRAVACSSASWAHHGLRSPSSVSNVVRRALARAKLDPPRKGAHLLCHSLAMAMLRNGASLAEIGRILPSTTQVYAKVDLEALRFVAAAWPGGAA